jgi:AraC-like DNA-binding protein
MASQLSIDAICRLIDALLPKGYPAIEEVARLLCVSVRSLQRRLNERGVSYSDLVERCRCRAACESLELSQDSIQDLSAKLGYSDASSFARAFRRWTGSAPRAWRNQSRCRQVDFPVPSEREAEAMQ